MSVTTKSDKISVQIATQGGEIAESWEQPGCFLLQSAFLHSDTKHPCLVLVHRGDPQQRPARGCGPGAVVMGASGIYIYIYTCKNVCLIPAKESLK